MLGGVYVERGSAFLGRRGCGECRFREELCWLMCRFGLWAQTKVALPVRAGRLT